MSDTDKDKIIAVLRDEVLAWRIFVIATRDTRGQMADFAGDVVQAIAATDAAGALEDK